MTRLLLEPDTDSSIALCEPPAEEARPSLPALVGPLTSAVKKWFLRATAEAWPRWSLDSPAAPKPAPSRRAKTKRQRPAKSAKRPEAVAPELDWSLLDRDHPLEWLALAHQAASALAGGHPIPAHGAERLADLAAKSKTLSLAADPLKHPLASGEIPLLLAALAGDSPEGNAWGEQARRALSRGVLDLCDGDGRVEAKHLPSFWQLLASWTRCRSLSRTIGGTCFDDEAETRLSGALGHALRLLRSDGSAVFSAIDSAAIRPLILAAIEEFAGYDERALAVKLLPIAWTRGISLPPAKKGKSPKRAKPGKKKKEAAPTHPPAGNFSDWAHFAQLRSATTRNATRLTLAYDHARMHSELEAAGRVVWSGEIDTRISLNGQQLAPAGEWEEVCTLQEDEADYIELSLDYEHGIELQRQLVLVREAGVVFLADVVLSPVAGEIAHEVAWPLTAGLSLHGAEETREAFLREGKQVIATIVPPALPEWQASPAMGSLAATDKWLQLQTKRKGKNLYAPLVVDLDPRRAKGQVTWRQLTIAENREPVSLDQAAGYRVKIGNRHWLFYRALGSKGNRTIFGVNLITEFLASRIDTKGIATTLIEVE